LGGSAATTLAAGQGIEGDWLFSTTRCGKQWGKSPSTTLPNRFFKKLA